MILKRIDTYILKRVGLPLLAATGIAMAALLLERLVRLLDLFANRGGPLSLIMEMLANLAPHYLAIAVPASLFVGVLVAFMRLSLDSELDAMRASGLSLRRLLLPILALSLLLAIASAYLIGFLQPYTRFAYRALVHIVTETAWDRAIERGAFFSGFGGKTVLIGDISDGGRKLSRIFVKEVDENGRDIVITAIEGRIERAPDLSLILNLSNGRRTEMRPGTTDAKAIEFSEIRIPMEPETPEPFRQRGERESELDFLELVRAYLDPPPFLQRSDIEAEIHHRAVRSLSVLFLPFLALPIGLSSRRAAKSLRLIVGIVFLILYYQIVQFGREIVNGEIAGPFLALWLPFLIFAAISVWLFHLADRRPGADPLAHVFDPLSAGLNWIGRLFRRRRSREARA